MGRTASKQAAALVRARQRRIDLDRERDARDRRVEGAAARALLLIEERHKAEQTLATINVRLGNTLQELLKDLTVNQAAAICELEASEARSLAKAAQQTELSGADVPCRTEAIDASGSENQPDRATGS